MTSYNKAGRTARAARSQLNFQRPTATALTSGCDRSTYCTSATTHHTGCPRLAEQLEQWKASRAAHYAKQSKP